MSWTAPWVTVEIGYGSTWQTEPGSITWTDETAKVLVDERVRATRGASSANGKVQPGTAEFSLLNADRRFDPTHATGDLFGDLLPGTPVRLLAWPVDQLLTVGGEIVLVDGLPVTTGSSIELWSGTVPSWPQRYDRSNRHAWCPISAYDRFDKLSRAKIPRSVLEAEILADSPLAYWPLDETSGAVMKDRSGNGRDGAYTAGTVDLSTERTTSGGFEVRGIEFDGEHSGIADYYPASVLSSNPTVTVELLVSRPTGSGYSLGFGNGNGSAISGGRSFRFYTDSNGQFSGSLAGVVIGFGAASVTSSPLLDPGIPSHVAYRREFNGNAELYVDGVSEADSVGFPGAWGAALPPDVMVGALKAGTQEAPTGVFLSSVALYGAALSAARIAAHADAANAPLDGQTTDERITWILDELGWPAGLRDLSTGRSLLGVATFKPGDGALEYLRLIEATEDGLLFIGPDGSLVFHDRYWRYLETVATVSQFTFTDQDGDQGYAEFQLDLDDELLVNVARFTRRDGAEQIATDSASITAYGEAEEQRTNLLSTTDARVRSLAEWTVSTRSTPLPRVPSIRIPLHRYSAADQATVLGLDLGHRVTVNRTPQGVGAQIDLDFLVEGMSHDIGFNEWWVNLFVSPVPQDTAELFLLGSSELGGTHILAH